MEKNPNRERENGRNKKKTQTHTEIAVQTGFALMATTIFFLFVRFHILLCKTRVVRECYSMLWHRICASAKWPYNVCLYVCMRACTAKCFRNHHFDINAIHSAPMMIHSNTLVLVGRTHSAIFSAIYFQLCNTEDTYIIFFAFLCALFVCLFASDSVPHSFF